MAFVSLMIQLVSGVVGGTAARGAFRPSATGALDSSLLGAVGGVCCAQVLRLGGFDGGSLHLASMAIQVTGGGVAGSALVLTMGLIRTIRRTGRSRQH